jgi:hypothetical protein
LQVMLSQNFLKEIGTVAGFQVSVRTSGVTNTKQECQPLSLWRRRRRRRWWWQNNEWKSVHVHLLTCAVSRVLRYNFSIRGGWGYCPQEINYTL